MVVASLCLSLSLSLWLNDIDQVIGMVPQTRLTTRHRIINRLLVSEIESTIRGGMSEDYLQQIRAKYSNLPLFDESVSRELDRMQRRVDRGPSPPRTGSTMNMADFEKMRLDSSSPRAHQPKQPPLVDSSYLQSSPTRASESVMASTTRSNDAAGGTALLKFPSAVMPDNSTSHVVPTKENQNWSATRLLPSEAYPNSQLISPNRKRDVEDNLRAYSTPHNNNSTAPANGRPDNRNEHPNDAADNSQASPQSPPAVASSVPGAWKRASPPAGDVVKTDQVAGPTGISSNATALGLSGPAADAWLQLHMREEVVRLQVAKASMRVKIQEDRIQRKMERKRKEHLSDVGTQAAGGNDDDDDVKGGGGDGRGVRRTSSAVYPGTGPRESIRTPRSLREIPSSQSRSASAAAPGFLIQPQQQQQQSSHIDTRYLTSNDGGQQSGARGAAGSPARPGDVFAGLKDISSTMGREVDGEVINSFAQTHKEIAMSKRPGVQQFSVEVSKSKGDLPLGGYGSVRHPNTNVGALLPFQVAEVVATEGLTQQRHWSTSKDQRITRLIRPTKDSSGSDLRGDVHRYNAREKWGNVNFVTDEVKDLRFEHSVAEDSVRSTEALFRGNQYKPTY